MHVKDLEYQTWILSWKQISLCEREAYAYAHKVLGIDMSLTAGIRISQKASFLWSHTYL